MTLSQKNLKKNDDVIDVDGFRQNVLEWYRKNARSMPWRASFGEYPHPYHEWLSEIMLQQTVVKTVIPYFIRFISIWPTIHDLASAHSDDIMREWAGLGYYARARNLHKCAKIISESYDGQFPSHEKELQALPGIGPYTAAAIRSIAFGKSSIVMDGNIERVLARIHAHEKPIKETKKQLYYYAKELSENRDDYPGEYAQALMDIGANICTPTSPKCTICPINNFCKSLENNLQETIPVKVLKQSKPQKYGVIYFIENNKGELLFEKRQKKGLLGGMLGLPGTEWVERQTPLKTAIKGFKINHTFTHFHLTLEGVLETHENLCKINKDYIWCDPHEYDKIGLPTLFKKAVKQYLNITKEDL